MTPMSSLVLLLLAHEILDVRDIHNGWPDLPRRVRGVADAPYTDAVLLFPQHRSAVIDLRQFNREYRRRLEDLRMLFGSRFDDEINETDRLFAIYEAISDAQCSYYYVHIRREALAKLRQMIGDEDFVAGRLPLPIPVAGGGR